MSLCRTLSAAKTAEEAAREAGKPKGSVITQASPENSKEYEALQTAWQKLEYTAEMKMLLDPLMEHKIELAAAGQVMIP